MDARNVEPARQAAKSGARCPRAFFFTNQPLRMNYPIQKSDDEWKALLAARGAEPRAFDVTRRAATERPFTGKYERVWADGSYHCICCGNLLFDAQTKFDAGCGWPSFSRAVPGAIEEITDRSHGMVRTETVCAQCGAHLGHVFPDGPPDTGLRYCMNSASLAFEPAGASPDAAGDPGNSSTSSGSKPA